MQLFDETTGNEIRVGDEVTTFRGAKGVLKSFNARRVYVQLPDATFASEFFPSVINAKVCFDDERRDAASEESTR